MPAQSGQPGAAPPQPSPEALALASELKTAAEAAEATAEALFLDEAAKRAQALALTLRQTVAKQGSDPAPGAHEGGITDSGQGDWARFRGSLETDPSKTSSRRTPPEYRERVDRYFRDLSEQ